MGTIKNSNSNKKYELLKMILLMFMDTHYIVLEH